MAHVWKSIFFSYLITNILFFITRSVFCIIYFPQEKNYTVTQILYHFLLGLRFDTAAFFMGFGPLFLLFFILPPLKYSLLFYRLIFSLILTLYLAIILGGLVYYGISAKHPTHEFTLFFKEFGDNLQMILRGYLIFFLAILSFAILSFFLSKRLVQLKSFKKPKWYQLLGQIFLFLLILILAIRGGLQKRPLRPAFAFSDSDDIFLANLTLNSVYTSFYSLFHKKELPIFHKVTQAEKEKFITKYFSPNEIVLNLDYPFYRKAVNRKFHPYNVIIFIMESWSARELGAYGGKKNVAPFFDSLSQKGLLFSNCYATNRRSIQSLPSIISSIPSFFGITYITSNYQTNRQTGLASLLKKKGYSSYFVYAAKKGSMGFDNYARQAGFSLVLSEEDFPKEFARDGTWGVFDEFTFLYVNDLFAKGPKPFLGVIYSLHPHPPFTLPKEKLVLYEELKSPYLKALRYSDDSLRKFFERAEKEDYFKNTLFVITADHAFAQEGVLQSHHIPLLFYMSKSNWPKGENKTLCSQLDILPTILHLLGYGEPYSAFGLNLFSQNPRYVVFDSDSFLVFLQNGYATIFDRNTPTALYSLKQYGQYNLIYEKKDLLSDFKNEYLIYISLMNHAILKNQITPP